MHNLLIDVAITIASVGFVIGLLAIILMALSLLAKVDE